MTVLKNKDEIAKITVQKYIIKSCMPILLKLKLKYFIFRWLCINKNLYRGLLDLTYIIAYAEIIYKSILAVWLPP